MTEAETEARIRQLERDQAVYEAKLQGIQDQQTSSWEELRRISRETRDEFKSLRSEHAASHEQLMAAIVANKLAWSMMNSGTKVAAWIILALASVGGAISGIVVMIRRLMD